MAPSGPSPIAAAWGRFLTLVPPGNRRFERPFLAAPDLSENFQIFRKMGFLDFSTNPDSVKNVCTKYRRFQRPDIWLKIDGFPPV